MLMLAGCCPTPPEPNYNVLTDPIAKVVADINANNSKVPTLWAHHYFEADVVDDKHRSHHASGDGVLLYTSPMSMRLITNAIIGKVFELGSNRQYFWLKLGPEAGDTMWWGTHANFANVDPDQTGMPIRPDMVLDVLGIATINNDFNALPVPTMRFDPYADAYVFVWNGKRPDRWFAMREVWYDRASKLPVLVLLYDANGRVVLRAEFNDPGKTKELAGRPKLNMKFYRQVAVNGLPKAQWPWIPSNYNLMFPDSGSRMTFSLDQAELKHMSDGDLIPQPGSFRMPSLTNSDVNRVIEIGGPPGPN